MANRKIEMTALKGKHQGKTFQIEMDENNILVEVYFKSGEKMPMEDFFFIGKCIATFPSGEIRYAYFCFWEEDDSPHCEIVISPN